MGGTATAAEAANALGDEIARFVRLVTAWKQRAKDDPAGGDRLLLSRLARCGPRRATDLAADTYLDLSTVSRQIRSLVDRGLVERSPDPEDRRRSIVAPTEEGLRAMERVRLRRTDSLADLLADWSQTDLDTLGAMFGRYNRAVAAKHLAPPPVKPDRPTATATATR